MAITGVVASITWGHYWAATIEGYTIARTGPKDAPRWSLSARVVLTDPFKFTQRPLMLVAPHEGGSWRWPIVQLERVGDRVTAELGPVEEHGTFRYATDPRLVSA